MPFTSVNEGRNFVIISFQQHACTLQMIKGGWCTEPKTFVRENGRRNK